MYRKLGVKNRKEAAMLLAQGRRLLENGYTPGLTKFMVKATQLPA
jgi:hypothetical protein